MHRTSSSGDSSRSSAALATWVIDDPRCFTPDDLQDLLTSYEAYFIRNLKHLLICGGLGGAAISLAIGVLRLPLIATVTTALLLMPVAGVVAVRQRRRQFLYEHGVSELAMKAIQDASRRAWRSGKLKVTTKDRSEVARQVHAELAAKD